MHQARSVKRWLATNQNTSGFTAKIPTITEPSGDGVLNLVDGGAFVCRRIKLWALLLGADNDVASLRFTGWHKVIKAGSTDLWIPSIIGEYVCTASAAIGIAGAAVVATERFADTIVPVAARQRDQLIAAGTAIGSEYELISPTTDLIAHVIIPIAGFEKLELTSDQTTNTPTVNCLYQFLDD